MKDDLLAADPVQRIISQRRCCQPSTSTTPELGEVPSRQPGSAMSIAATAAPHELQRIRRESFERKIMQRP